MVTRTIAILTAAVVTLIYAIISLFRTLKSIKREKKNQLLSKLARQQGLSGTYVTSDEDLKTLTNKLYTFIIMIVVDILIITSISLIHNSISPPLLHQ